MRKSSEFSEELSLSITEVRFQTLGREWNTNNFQHESCIIPYNRLYMPIEGHGVAVHHEREYNLTPGKIYLIPPFTPVHLSCDGRLVKYWLHFNVYIFKSNIDIFSVFDTEYEIMLENSGFFKELFERLCKIHLRNDTVSLFESRCLLGEIIIPFLEKMNKTQSSLLFTIYEILNYIERNIEKPLSLKKLAEIVGLNPTYLSNMFAERMGVSLMRYCIQRRISHAIGLFKNNKLRLGEIAQKSGFEKAETFTKLFKRHTGLTPGNYRKKILAEPDIAFTDGHHNSSSF
ncbi:MAG: AraC-type transcriptional regulator [Candidatus Uhrbacteria bacterium GW2011_GWF2_39_13]|uniref:AraC-type transcriptional regulator n=1 Tax=Candidatus Uhrbacteria bacterium GW2011_GWF2_39_13 TaxID=1618995 RepID=A0A0G0MHI4_9BACT|nr:MAG: AraC-type transcriptional regulator [Candidatus Uhrbacteria bacterium GW2011_GWF2_39_13]